MTNLTTLDVPSEGDYEYALRLPEANPFGKAKPHYDIPFRDYGPDGRGGGKSRARHADDPPTEKEVAVPAVIGLYAGPERDPGAIAMPQLGPGELSDKARHDSPFNQGWLYVYVDGFLWRELEVRGGSIDAEHNMRGEYTYVDVNLETHMGKDLRPASVQPVFHLLLPHKVAGRVLKVEIAYARVQWSWSRVVAYGGIHPADPRWEAIAPVCLPQKEWPEAARRRAKRFQRIDLGGYHSDWSEQPGSRTKAGLAAVDSLRPSDTVARAFLENRQGQGLPMLLLDDPLGWAKDRAYAYQSAWREMEEYINDLSNPDHEGEKQKEFPFAPWFDSAVLANRYFFAPAPDLEAPNVSKSQRKELVKAME